jgi:fructan beta-fructosidase
MDELKDFSIVISNPIGEELVIGYDKIKNKYFIDRTRSGRVNFYRDFAATHTAPRFSNNSKMELSLILDVSSVELFADGGLTVMTEIFFPNRPYNKITIQSPEGASVKKLSYGVLKGDW